MKNKLLLLVLLLLIKTRADNFHRSPSIDKKGSDPAVEIKDKLKLGGLTGRSSGFTENKGQVFGFDGQPHSEVKFVFQQGNTQIFLLEKGIAYQFTKVHYPEGYQEMMRGKPGPDEMEKLQALQKQIRTETFRMDMTLQGANQHAKISSEGKSADYTNFYTHDVLDVHSYSKITYHEIYPGIDWVIYKNGEQLKYDFVVRPGADPSLIKIKFSHQEKLVLNSDGSFSLKNILGSITEKSPVSFQKTNLISTKFILNEDIISFELEKFDCNETLIIDPALVWATYYGNSSLDVGYSCSVDLAGNIYLAGYTPSTANIASGGHQNTYGGGANDAFLVKFSSNGLRLWGTYYGGTNDDLATTNACDGSGNVFLSGYTSSSVSIASGGHQNSFGGGTTDGFLVKFNGNGVRQWATYYGGAGSGFEMGWGCVSDGSGNVYLSGFTPSTVNIASAGHQNTYGGGGYDAFLVKFNSSGVRQWGTYYGGTDYDQGLRCTCDASANVYLSGNSTSTTNIASAGFQSTYGGGSSDAFLVKFNTSGVRQWGTYYGGTGEDKGTSCALDGSGNVYLAGYTTSGTDIASGGHQNSIGGGSYDAFLVKFNSSGLRQWGTYYGGSGNELSYSCATSASSDVFLSGYTSSNIGISSGGVQNTYGGGTYDAFLVKFNTAGARQWGTYFGGSGQDVAMFCTSDATGNFYLVGHTSSTGNISFGGYQNTYGGGQDDAFLAKFCDMPTQPSAISGNTVICANSSQTYSVIINPAALSYTWSLPTGWLGSSIANTISITPNASGVFSVASTNACGNSPFQTLSVSVSPLPSITVNNGSICNGQSFTISPSGVSTYTISGGSTIVSPVSNTSYSVSGTSSAGCISAIAAVSTVTVNAIPVISVNSGSICNGQSFTISPSGANTYTVSGGSMIVNPVANSNYSVSGTSSAGCVSALPAVAIVTVNAIPIISANSGSICYGLSFTISPSGASTYTVSGGSMIVSPSVVSTYSVSGTSPEGCISLAPAISNVFVFVLPTITVNSGTICNGQSFTLIPGGANTYTYSGGAAVVSPVLTTTYSVNGTDNNGCVSNIAALSTVTVNALPILTVTSSQSTICEGETATLTASGANSYTWNGNSTGITFVISPASTTSFSLNGTDNNSCSNSTTFSQVVDPCVNIKEGIRDQISFNIYPNPNHGEFIVEIEKEMDLTIYNALGQVIIVQHVVEGKNAIDLNNQSNGVYFVIIKLQETIYKTKVIKD